MSIITKPKKETYRIQYADNTYLIIELDKYEWQKICEAKIDNQPAVATEELLLDLHEIRTIVYIPPVPEATKEEIAEQKNKAEHQLSEWGFVDPETAMWLAQNGIDISRGED